MPDDDYFEDDDDIQTDALQEYGDITRVPFSREDLINAQSLRTSDYSRVVINVINDLPFTMEYRQALARWVHAHLSKDVILANFSPQKSSWFAKSSPADSALLGARIALMKTRFARSKSDTLKPAANTIEDDLCSVYEALISRTVGNKRERLINNRQETASEIIQRTGTIDQPSGEQNTKKGWFKR